MERHRSAFEHTRPQWLASYPNKGPLDYFGFRFLRQTKREHLFRSAASNNFANAKALIYYPAISIEFRRQHSIDDEQELTNEQMEAWLQWYQRANFLFVTHQTMKFDFTYDNGFTGAKRILDLFKPFTEGQQETLDFNLYLPIFYGGNKRPFGYLKQFWSGSLGFYHSIQNIDHCRVGEYGEEAHQLLSSFEQWPTLLRVIKSGIVSRKELDSLESVLTCENLSRAEKLLVQKMILDRDRHHEESALIYDQSFNAFCRLFDEYEVYNVDTLALDVITLFLYRYYTGQPLYNAREGALRTLCNSYPFEVGLVLLFKRLSREATSRKLTVRRIRNILAKDIDAWLDSHNKKGESFASVVSSFHSDISTGLDGFKESVCDLYDLESPREDLWVDGVLLGYLAYKIDLADADRHQTEDWYTSMTDEYYSFVPQVAFRNFGGANHSFAAALSSFALNLLKRQYDFAIERIQLGQIAKFLTLPATDIEAFQFEVDEDNILPQDGVIGLFKSMLSLWQSAGLLTKASNRRIRAASY